eukprot:1161045-Pelagomonas_calceolata.AAC.9
MSHLHSACEQSHDLIVQESSADVLWQALSLAQAPGSITCTPADTGIPGSTTAPAQPPAAPLHPNTHQQLVGPEKDAACNRLQLGQVSQLLVHTNVAQQHLRHATQHRVNMIHVDNVSDWHREQEHDVLAHLKACADGGVKGGELFNGVAEHQVRKQGVDDEDHKEDDGEVDEIRACQPQRASDHPQVGLEVHAAQHAHDEQQDGDATQRKVPAARTRMGGGATCVGRAPGFRWRHSQRAEMSERAKMGSCVLRLLLQQSSLQACGRPVSKKLCLRREVARSRLTRLAYKNEPQASSRLTSFEL